MQPKFGIQAANKANEVGVERGQPVPKLDHVEPTLASFDLTDESLVSAESLCKVSLAQAACHAQASQHGEEDFVVTAIQDLGHDDLSWQR